MIEIKHILITAGGTTENIDSVRKIGNSSTGALGAHIYDALSEHISKNTGNSTKTTPEFTVHYVVSSTAVKPTVNPSLPVIFYEITDVKSAKAIIEKILKSYDIGCAVHSMAVSDFTKGYLARLDELADELVSKIDAAINNGPPTKAELADIVAKTLEMPDCVIDTSEKISSKHEMILSLNKTPKLIEIIRVLSPDTFLVGFKLLNGVTEQELVKVGHELAQKNSCELVLANDMAKIKDGRHEGLLLKDGKVIARYNTKEEIAKGIAQNMLKGAFGF